MSKMFGLFVFALQECFRPADPFLEGHDLVLQAERDSKSALINAVMASVPRHSLWEMVIEIMMERAHALDGINSVFSVTGPKLPSDAFANYSAAQHSTTQVQSWTASSMSNPNIDVTTWSGSQWVLVARTHCTSKETEHANRGTVKWYIPDESCQQKIAGFYRRYTSQKAIATWRTAEALWGTGAWNSASKDNSTDWHLKCTSLNSSMSLVIGFLKMTVQP